MLTGFRRSIIAAILLVANSLSAHAVDEIQVYNAEIAKVGQWTMQLHLNYAFLGRKEPDFPGGLIPHRALNGAPEWAYGITDWWEMGFYAPFAVDQNGTSYSNAIKIRQLFVTPNAADREIFYGVNFEFSYAMPQFSDAKWNMEIRADHGYPQGRLRVTERSILWLERGAPGHHGYQRACELISGQASTGPFGSPVFACAGKTEPPSHITLMVCASAGRQKTIARIPTVTPFRHCELCVRFPLR
jgi:hypothetical protein